MRKGAGRTLPCPQAPGKAGEGAESRTLSPTSRILGVSPRLSRYYLPTLLSLPPPKSGPLLHSRGSTLVSELQ